MTERDLRHAILEIAYKAEKNGTPRVSQKSLMDAIPQADENSLRRSILYLKDKGFLERVASSKDNISFAGLSSAGVEYVEDNVLRNLPSENRDTLDMPMNSLPALNDKSYYECKSHREPHKDKDVAACFNVDSLAACFLDQIDDVCDCQQSNIPMIGIFAPWGRGKSYFFNRIKEKINSRSDDASAIKYDVVEFNAWKYQDAPALWAYLFETMYSSRGRWFRWRYSFRRNWNVIALFALIPAIMISASVLIDVDVVNRWKWAVSFLSVVAFVISLFLQHFESATSLIKKHSRRTSFSKELGIQAEISRELMILLKSWTKGDRHRVMLYVDDIDRCSDEKMLDTVEALRTMLEEKEICKRLVVVCSADMFVLDNALKRRYKNTYPDYPMQDIRCLCNDQIDKIFVSSISLQALTEQEQLEYWEKLAGVKRPVISTRESLLRSYLSNVPASELSLGKKEKDHMTKDRMIEILIESVEYRNLHLTPRQLRHIYYRSLLAMNILAFQRENISSQVIHMILARSCNETLDMPHEEMVVHNEVINMVVPYGSLTY